MSYSSVFLILKKVNDLVEEMVIQNSEITEKKRKIFHQKIGKFWVSFELRSHDERPCTMDTSEGSVDLQIVAVPRESDDKKNHVKKNSSSSESNISW